MDLNDEFYMSLAINAAWKYQGLSYPNPAVGCAILSKDGRLLSVGAHKKAGFAHAELAACWRAALALAGDGASLVLDRFFKFLDEGFDNNELKQRALACLKMQSQGLESEFYIYSDSKISNFSNALELENFLLSRPKLLYAALLECAPFLGLGGASAYLSLEPCAHSGRTPPCANLLLELGFKRVVISIKDPHAIAAGGADMLARAGVEIKLGVLKAQGEDLLEPFLRWQLGSGFKFAKLALSLNGGYLGDISSPLSKTHMHALRTRLELLAIGGGTFKADKPTLDARLIGGRAPDVLIFSKDLSKIPKDAPAFGVGGRQIFMQESPQSSAKFVMYEGAGGLLELIASSSIPGLEHILLYQTACFSKSKSVKADIKMRQLFSMPLGKDRLGWFKIE